MDRDVDGGRDRVGSRGDRDTDQKASLREPTLSKNDQTLSDRDQTASDSDQTASDSDSAGSRSDQRSSDQDQAASDRDFEKEGSHTPASRDAHEESRDEREDATDDRRVAEGQRRDSGDLRARTTSQRDQTAAARDEAARLRDAQAELIEATIASSDEPLAKKLQMLREQVAAERAHAAADRRRAAAERTEAARERAGLEAELATSHLDDLTGAYRRTMGDLVLSNEIARARRADERFVIGFVDVDGLKVINDRDGHPAGDSVLRTVVGTIRSCLRSFDPIVRYGGDEFVCGLSGTDVEEVRRRFDAIERMLKGESVGITVGLAALQDGEMREQLIARADAALLEAKAQRRR